MKDTPIVCRKCGSPHLMGNGAEGVCKKCHRERINEWRSRPGNYDKHREISRASRCRHPETDLAYQQKHTGTIAFRARRVLNNAVADGRIVKPTSCSICGKEVPSLRLHGHHPDYNFPLRVLWCCARCHKKLHKLMDNLEELKRLSQPLYLDILRHLTPILPPEPTGNPPAIAHNYQ